MRLNNTGAWQPDDPPGNRRFVTTHSAEAPLALISGQTLGPVTMSYEAWGTLDADRSNAVLVLPPLSMTSHAAGPAGPGHRAEGWWDGLIGPGKAVDTDRFQVIVANNLGGCDGSTGPASLDPTGRPWAARFPALDVVDQVNAEAALADTLGIERWHTVIGMSIGGARALEWAVSRPERVGRLLLIAVAAATRVEQAGHTHIELELIRRDPHFHGGEFYHLPEGCGPRTGVSLARSFAHIRYGTESYWQDRFGGQSWYHDSDGCHEKFREYVLAQGDKVWERFDANCCLVLSETALSATVARGRGGIDDALARITAPTRIVGFSTDRAYPPETQRELAAGIREAEAHIMETDLGHYGFMLAPDLVEPHLRLTLG
ncbi:homoserine O-acetyltransferase [Streptomyces sp. cf386]|uniref:homoserine O-acetyltransferase MetX n=1 Tax=Streptomyces sp. cf386 TaxID=1761904 RepID=UPI00088B8418|nr:homoserine O-acetyltransferase [Streptomyces sp. cf386]SDP40540.1 homoserine O-acetyltransferase [Streptomyces sp. cf386]